MISIGWEITKKEQSWTKESFVKINTKDALGLISLMTDSEWKAYCILLCNADSNGCCKRAVECLVRMLSIPPREAEDLIGRLLELLWGGAPVLTAIKKQGQIIYSLCGLPQIQEEPSKKDMIVELTSLLFRIPGIEQKKGCYKIIGKAYNRYGYECVLQAIQDLEFEIMGRSAVGLPVLTQADINKMFFARCEWNQKKSRNRNTAEPKTVLVNKLLEQGYILDGNTIIPPDKEVGNN